jgi:long-chain acyl-CoA synthetase
LHPGIHAEQRPDHPAIIMGSGVAITYAQLESQANRAAHLFAEIGLRPGDHLALQVGNQPEFFYLVWAAHRSGLWYTPMSTHLGPEETAYIVNDCAAKVLVVSAGLDQTLLGLEPGDTPNITARYVVGGAAARWASWDEAVRRQSDRPPGRLIAGNDLMYSSGTTGRPKGIERSTQSDALDEFDSVTLLAKNKFRFDADTVYLSPAPLYHSAALRFTRSVHRLGGTVVQMERFDAEKFLRLVEMHRVTASQLVPTMFVRMLKLDEQVRNRYDLSSLNAVFHAAAPCPIPIKQRMIDWWGPIIWEHYSGSEGVGMVVSDSKQWLAHPGTVGRQLNAQIHIVGEDNQELPVGTPGTIYFESTADFVYRNDPEKTAAAHNDRGWKTLGDIGYLDEEGFLYLTDRKANMIISGGVNIYPQEVENLLTLHPKVGDVAVFGVPNGEMGEEVKAVVQPAPGVAGSPGLETELIAHCQDHLAHYKCPRSIDFAPELPRDPNGKLYKRLLKDRYWEGHASRIV